MSLPTIADMIAEVRALNTDKGWRTTPPPSFREYRALLHTEIAESTDAYRRWKLNDATKPICGRAAAGEEPCPDHGSSKPEGVGPEIADTLIRFLDMVDALNLPLLDTDFALADIAPADPPADVVTFVDHTDWLHEAVAALRPPGHPAVRTVNVLRTIVAVSERHNIDLPAEYRRKMAHNWTRPVRHGGKHL